MKVCVRLFAVAKQLTGTDRVGLELPDGAPAAEYRYRDGRGRISQIDSVSVLFCNRCNRLRLTARCTRLAASVLRVSR
jgi:molybdenum cofactor biosynthesis enzyme MoaA